MVTIGNSLFQILGVSRIGAPALPQFQLRQKALDGRDAVDFVKVALADRCVVREGAGEDAQGGEAQAAEAASLEDASVEERKPPGEETDEGNFYWIEAKKPGELFSLRGGQCLAQIVPKY